MICDQHLLDRHAGTAIRLILTRSVFVVLLLLAGSVDDGRYLDAVKKNIVGYK